MNGRERSYGGHYARLQICDKPFQEILDHEKATFAYSWQRVPHPMHSHVAPQLTQSMYFQIFILSASTCSWLMEVRSGLSCESF
jgi:hypothetical protein